MTNPHLRPLVGWATAAGTLPYLTLKAVWITGGTAGTTDPAFLRSPVMIAANSLTFVLDLLVIGLAMALTHGWGRRVPVWALLLPVWVGTGFLVPMALVVLPTALLAPTPAGASALAPWVGPTVYGGFAWQGVFLAVAFVLHVRERWAARVATPGPAGPLLRVVAGGGTVMAALSAAAHLAAGATGATAAGMAVGNAAFAVAGAAGVRLLVRGGRTHRTAAAAAAWTGSAAMFSWGLYSALLTMVVNPLGGGVHGLAGLAQLTGLLGGFALAVAALLTLPPTRRVDDSSTPTSPIGHVDACRIGDITVSERSTRGGR